jgi:hypothetical protein
MLNETIHSLWSKAPGFQVERRYAISKRLMCSPRYYPERFRPISRGGGEAYHRFARYRSVKPITMSLR